MSPAVRQGGNAAGSSPVDLPRRTAALRHGYTTGACAAAAAKGAALLLREQRLVDEIDIILPAGVSARFRLHGQRFTPNSATCFVVKDAGDDPDVTNGAEIHATVDFAAVPPSPRSSPTAGDNIVIEGGLGVGKVTKPGLAVAVGEWAINPVPRRMIEEGVRDVFPVAHCLHCRISIPNGEELARKTLNARLGIIGGLSILGTTGIVKPISVKAWTDTIDAAIDVALACGSDTVVLSTGRTSEMAAQAYLGIGCRQPAAEQFGEEAYVMMGDHVGYALRSCKRKGVRRVILAGQFGKFLKIACGHEQTHVSSSQMDLQALAAWLEADPHFSLLAPSVRSANTARQVLELSGNDPELVRLICGKVAEFAKTLASEIDIQVFLAGYRGEMLYCAELSPTCGRTTSLRRDVCLRKSMWLAQASRDGKVSGRRRWR